MRNSTILLILERSTGLVVQLQLLGAVYAKVKGIDRVSCVLSNIQYWPPVGSLAFFPPSLGIYKVNCQIHISKIKTEAS